MGVKSELKFIQKTRSTNQGQCHAHDHREVNEVECGDLQYVAIRIRVSVDILILSGQRQGLDTTIPDVSLL